MKRALLLLLSIFVLMSCSTGLPDWYKNREDYYPEDLYIIAEGWGQSPEKAVENATINMARIFNVKVCVEENILKRYASISNMKEFEEYFSEFSEETAKLITEQHLVNIMFLEPAFDKKSKSYFTLSYIERSKTARILMDRMKREQENIDHYIRMAQSTRDPLETYHYYASAWLTSAKTKMMQEQLDVLIPGSGIKPAYTYAELEAQKDKAAGNILFKIDVKGDSNGRIRQAIRTAVNKVGFTVVDSGENINVHAGTLIKKIDIDQDKLAFVSWELQMKMNDPQGKTALSLMEEGREGSTNYPNAEMHAYERMQKFVETEFQDKLNAYFDTMKK